MTTTALRPYRYADQRSTKVGFTAWRSFKILGWLQLFLLLSSTVKVLGFTPYYTISAKDDSFSRDHVVNQFATPTEKSESDGIPMDNSRLKAYPQQTPSSGRHFLPSHPAFRKNRVKQWYWKRRHRFMEGWYYRLTLVERNISFAFIVSIEDPGLKSDLRLACMQIVSDDGYLVQADRDDSKFWAWEGQQALGCTFEFQSKTDEEEMKYRTAMSSQEWRDKVKSGFQVMPSHLLGRIEGHDGSQGGVLKGQGVPGSCEFDIAITPICGWGGTGDVKQRSTGGWLSFFEVFEPHWQVTMSDARASGRVVWNNESFVFEDEPFYAEKNWGKSLPSKWYWTQCNSFDGYDQLSVTAGGGVRKVPFGQQEALGMVSVHYNGTFFEAVPWNGAMEWNVSTWGYWHLRGKCTSGDRPFEVEVTYECDPETLPGLVFRAPTPDQGMVNFCRDTFEAAVNLTLWELEWDSEKKEYVRMSGPPLIDGAKSSQGGAEVGGGPWWDNWMAKSKLKVAVNALLQIPYRVRNLRKRLKM
jgi:tocopherol cyclase